jgi:hypothetical protein
MDTAPGNPTKHEEYKIKEKKDIKRGKRKANSYQFHGCQRILRRNWRSKNQRNKRKKNQKLKHDISQLLSPPNSSTLAEQQIIKPNQY